MLLRKCLVAALGFPPSATVVRMIDSPVPEAVQQGFHPSDDLVGRHRHFLVFGLQQVVGVVLCPLQIHIRILSLPEG
jgi:hypothetical protein